MGQPHPTRDNGDYDDDDDDDSATPLIGEEAAAGFIRVQFDADAGANVALLWSRWGWGGGSTSGNDLVTSDADSCHKQQQQQQLYAHNSARTPLLHFLLEEVNYY